MVAQLATRGIQGLVPQHPARRRRRIGDHVAALITQARLEHDRRS
jgi:hypothetical protein